MLEGLADLEKRESPMLLYGFPDGFPIEPVLTWLTRITNDWKAFNLGMADRLQYNTFGQG